MSHSGTESLILQHGIRVRFIKSRKTQTDRVVKWLVAEKTVVIGTRVGDHYYVRVRPKYGFSLKRGMTPEEVEAVASSIIDVNMALRESLYGEQGP